ncbi:MAG: hypothetical protein KF873_05485 [Gemmataceae bacterium]|nr:hypothetical protein [Planctomycetia bacterium]MBX3398171.1 hypothetical protein [Gemmataceae bacterium]
MEYRPPVAFSVMVLVGLAGYVGCLVRHFCMCGHMFHREHIRWWDYPIDGVWIVGFGAAAVYAVFRMKVRSLFPAAILVLLILSRLFLAHTMGISIACFEAPVSIVLFIICGFTLFDRLVGGEPPYDPSGLPKAVANEGNSTTNHSSP